MHSAGRTLNDLCAHTQTYRQDSGWQKRELGSRRGAWLSTGTASQRKRTLPHRLVALVRVVEVV